MVFFRCGTEKWLKMPIFRIFCELMSKSTSQSPCFRASREGTVEIGVAHPRALTLQGKTICRF